MCNRGLEGGDAVLRKAFLRRPPMSLYERPAPFAGVKERPRRYFVGSKTLLLPESEKS